MGNAVGLIIIFVIAFVGLIIYHLCMILYPYSLGAKILRDELERNKKE